MESPPSRVATVELFTSQGCSSCPPADAWLSRLAHAPGLWEQFIPMAWHVDYWDFLGWRDRHANPSFADRHRAYRGAGSLKVVYTPAVLVAGREVRDWGQDSPSIPPPSDAPGTLRLTFDGGRAILTFEPADPHPAHTLRGHLALLGMGLRTRVAAGENRGRALAEDFVVLDHQTAAPVAADGHPQWRFGLPLTTATGASRLALAAWVSRPPDPTPLQALGGWLP